MALSDEQQQKWDETLKKLDAQADSLLMKAVTSPYTWVMVIGAGVVCLWLGKVLFCHCG